MANGRHAGAPDLRQWTGQGDELADAVVAQLLARAGGDDAAKAAALEAVLNDVMQWRPETPLPAPTDLLGPFLEPETGFLPQWCSTPADFARIQRAQDFFQRHRVTAFIVLGCASLPHCYGDREVAATLILSGRLAAQVRQRIADTANFVSAVMRPDALVAGGQGPRWIRKIRLMHAIMRQMTLEDPTAHSARDGQTPIDAMLTRSWNKPAFAPIDKVELAFVLLTFSLVILKGWRTLGVPVPSAVAEDYLFAWSVVGHVLGVPDALLPRPGAESALSQAEALFTECKRCELGTEDGRLLTAALLVLLTGFSLDDARALKLPAFLEWSRPIIEVVLRTFPRSLVRELIGSDTAAALWVEPAPFLQRAVHWIVIRTAALWDSIAWRLLPERFVVAPWGSSIGNKVESLRQRRR